MVTLPEGQAALLDGAHGFASVPVVPLSDAGIFQTAFRAALIRNKAHHPEWNAVQGR